MKYTPNISIKQEEKQDLVKQQAKKQLSDAMDTLLNLPRNPVSDTTNFIVQSTTVDLSGISDIKFKEQMELYLLVINKFSALSNLTDSDQTLTRLLWQDLKYALKFGFQTRAKVKALELIHLYNESRGRNGKFSAQLITTREELIAKHMKDEDKKEKKGFWGFKQKEEVVDEGVDGEFTK